MKPLLYALLVASVLLSLAAAPLVAQQNANLEQGLKPYGSYQSGNIDSVSLTNGNLSVHIPLVSYPQRGGKLHLGFFLRYNNKGWQGQQFMVNGQPHWRWVWKGTGVRVVPDIGLGEKLTLIWVIDQVTGSKVPVQLYDALSLDGSSHQLLGTESVDASGIQFNSLSGLLIDRDGIRYTQTGLGGGSYASTIEDPNGNQITASASGWTDTLGRVIPASALSINQPGPVPGVSTTDLSQCPSGTSSALIWNLPGPSNGTSVIKLCYLNVSLQSQFNYPGFTEGSAPDTFLSAVILPNGTSWQFAYNTWGDLTQITFPTGGTLSYTWTNLVACSWTSTPENRAVASRTLNANDGTGGHAWSYSYTIGTPNTTIVTDPAGNDAVHAVNGAGEICSLFVTQSQYYQGPTERGPS